MEVCAFTVWAGGGGGSWSIGHWFIQCIADSYPYAQRTHILRLLGPMTLLYKAFGLF